MHRICGSWLAILMTLTALTACADQLTDPAQGIPLADREALRALGLDAESAQDHGEYYVVEGDIEVSKIGLRAGQLARAANTQSVFLGSARPGASLPVPTARTRPGGPSLQAHTTTLTLPARVRTIKVDLSDLASEPDWQAAARRAMANWNGIAGSAVTMVEDSVTADITVIFEDMPVTTLGSASWPYQATTGGGPGPIIRINTDHLAITDSRKDRLLTHELGHTIGFRHTDWQAQGESATGLGAVTVPGTSGSDSGSVMNAGGQAWTGFTASDERAAITMYGDTTALSISYTPSGPVVSWNAIAGATNYYLNVLYVGAEDYTDPNPPYDVTRTTIYNGRTVGSTTGTSLTDSTSSYTASSYCYHYSYPNDWNWSGGYYTSYYWLETVFPNGSSHSHQVALICTP